MYSQRFQGTVGTAAAENKWAVVLNPAINAYVAIGNATVNGISNVWITSYNAGGTVLTSAIANAGRNIIARDISIAPIDPITGQQTYYITGWTQVVFMGIPVNQIFVGRIFINGVFMWYSENPIGGGGNDKEGVAVVTAPNGDVVVAGHVLWPVFPGGSQVILSRFNPLGAIIWTNVYLQPGYWIVREMSLGVPSPGCARSI